MLLLVVVLILLPPLWLPPLWLPPLLLEAPVRRTARHTVVEAAFALFPPPLFAAHFPHPVLFHRQSHER